MPDAGSDLVAALCGGEIKDEYVVCRSDGTVISTCGVKSLKSATKLASASFYRCIGSSDAARLALMLDEVRDDGQEPHFAGFEVRGMVGYRYALVEIRSDFGEQYMIVRLYKTKRDYFASDFVKNGRIASIYDSFSSNARAMLAKITMGDTAAAAAMIADSSAISSMAFAISSEKNEPRTFDIAVANKRIAEYYSQSDAKSSTDCVLVSDTGASSTERHFIIRRDVDCYVKMIVSLVSAMSLVSVSRTISLKTECFGGCARVMISTDAADARLLALSFSDLTLVSAALPRLQTRLTEAEYFASLLDVRLRASGSISGGTFSFSITLTNDDELPVEFKHPDPLSDIGGIIAASCAMFPMSSISAQEE